ncbi:MAG: hypothetical protein HOV80_31305, partial [Polyangiaceae bacterium]|nr:hypothetical protein [Polyangiaceae bacterium]
MSAPQDHEFGPPSEPAPWQHATLLRAGDLTAKDTYRILDAAETFFEVS